MMFTVKKIANKVGLTTDAVRHYIEKGLLTPQRDPTNNYRVFSTTDVTRLAFIKQCRLLGYSIADISLLLEDASANKSPCPRAREVLQKKITEVDKAIAELYETKKALAHTLANWQKKPDGQPTTSIICPLIQDT